MIHCHQCSKAFHPRHLKCPACGTQANTEDRLPYLASWIEDAVDQGQSPEEIRETLLEEGIPSHLAHRIVTERISTLRGEVRSRGLLQFSGGAILLFLACAALAFCGYIFYLDARAAARLRHVVVLSVVGFLAGIRLAYVGSQNLISGRDEIVIDDDD